LRRTGVAKRSEGIVPSSELTGGEGWLALAGSCTDDISAMSGLPNADLICPYHERVSAALPVMDVLGLSVMPVMSLP